MRANPNWKVRRRYVAGSWLVGVVMVMVGSFAVWSDKLGAVDLIGGGVALMTLVVGSYIGGAVTDDYLQKRRTPDGEME